MKDIIVIGAGPAGLAVAIAAKIQDLDCLVIEKGTIVNSIVHFPTDMVFFSSADLLEIGGLPFNSSQIKPTRREAVRYYQQVVRYFGLSVILYQKCIGLKGNSTGYILETNNIQTGKSIEYEAKNIVFATGFYDYPKLLNVPGEDLPHVTHYYNEPFMYYNQDVVIVGAGNSAVEAALEIYRNGGRVTIINRNSEIKNGVKYWILPDILNRINEGKIRFKKNARVTTIDNSEVTYESEGSVYKIPAQYVLALTGYQPGRSILDHAKVSFNKETLEPVVDTNNFESSRKGIYFAGSLIAGIFPNRIFIENSREHGEKIVKHIITQKG